LTSLLLQVDDIRLIARITCFGFGCKNWWTVTKCC